MKIFSRIAVPSALCLLAARPCLAQLSTGATSPGTAADVSPGGSKFTWNDPSGALSPGGTAASSTTLLSVNSGTTDYLQLTNFGLSIPIGSTIDGIEVDITRQATSLGLTIAGITINGSITDNIIQLVGPGVNSANRATGSAWPAGSSTAVYGSSSDGWGSTVWTAAMVNSASFGVDISTTIHGGSLLGTNLIPGASIDAVTVKITYSLPTTLALSLDQWSATRGASGNLLRWQAAAEALAGAPVAIEAASSAFIVEMSANNRDWTDLARIPATSGSHRDRGDGALYSYTDEDPLANGTAYYRLRLQRAGQADRWSTVQVLAARLVRPLISVYPNPFYDRINVSAPGRPFSRLVLRNALGAIVCVKDYPAGTTNAQIPAANLPPGPYFPTVDRVNAAGGVNGVGGESYSLCKKS